MKKLIIILIFSVIYHTACTTGPATKVNPGFQHFRISVEQDNVIKEINNHIVELEKKPFTIIVSFIGFDSIFVNASFTHESYIAALNGEPVDTIKGLQSPAMNEELFNKEALIYISEKSPNYWYYTNDNDHRFSEVIKKSEIYLCRRNVASVYVTDKNKKIDIADIPANEIYLVFMKAEWNKDYSKKIEIKREYLKLNFNHSGKTNQDISSNKKLPFPNIGDLKIN